MAPVTRLCVSKMEVESAPAPPPIAVVKIEKKRPAPENPKPSGAKNAKFEAKTQKIKKEPAEEISTCVKKEKDDDDGSASNSKNKKKAATVVNSTIPAENAPDFGKIKVEKASSAKKRKRKGDGSAYNSKKRRRRHLKKAATVVVADSRISPANALQFEIKAENATTAKNGDGGASKSKKKATTTATVVNSPAENAPDFENTLDLLYNSLGKKTKKGKISRHCAFCLIPLADKDVRKCGKCQRRAYCTRDCQRKDWTSKKSPGEVLGDICEESGQGHKDWCGVPVCEEDLDWYVKEGGKGIVAKRLILKGERILVGNVNNCKNTKKRSGRGPILAAFNHSCDANSATYHGMDYKVMITSAEKDILPGTEITMNYVGFNVNFKSTSITFRGEKIRINSFEESRAVLASRFGITCPPNCFCYDKEIEQILMKRKEFIRTLGAFASSCFQLGRAVVAEVKFGFGYNAIQNMQEDIAHFEKIRGIRVMKGLAICALLTLLDREPQKKHLIPKYEKEAEDIFKSVFHPNSAFTGVGAAKKIISERTERSLKNIVV